MVSLLYLFSLICYLAGCVSGYLLEKEAKKYLAGALICLHIQIPMFLLLFFILVLLLFTENFPACMRQDHFAFLFIGCYLSLPAFYFVYLLFQVCEKKKLWRFFCISCLASILSFAWVITILLRLVSRQ